MEFLRKHFRIRLDPFYINNQIFLISGFGHLNSPHRWKNVLYNIYSSLCFSSLTIIFTLQILDIYLLLDDLESLREDLCAVIVTVTVVTKMYFIPFRSHLVEDLQRDFMRFRMSRTHPEEEEIWKKASKKIYTFTKIFYSLGTPCVLFWIFFPALDKPKERTLPYPWIFPVDYRLSPYYEIIYAFQSLTLFSFLINLLSLDIGYCSYVVLIIAQFDALSRDLRIMSSAYDDEAIDEDAFSKRKVPREKTEASIKALGNSVKVHNYILRQVEKVNAIHGDVIFCQMAWNSLLIAFLFVDMALNNEEFNLKLIQRLLYTSSAAFDAWIMCFTGTELQERGLSFVQELYDLPWTEMDVQVQKILRLMMMRAQKVPRLKNVMIYMGRPLFMEIMKFSYNFVALLKG